MPKPRQTPPSISSVSVDMGQSQGPLELWRNSFGLGGISPEPLPAMVVAGMKQLRPRLVRIFIQEFFNIYPDHDRYEWTRLDAYMESVASTGAKIVAAITIKPPVLFPTVDQTRWEPNDKEEWQRLIFALVRRYSVEKPMVTHWEVANETDIGEEGGAPYLIPDATDYGDFYQMTIRAVLDAFPSAKVGGPAACWIDNEPLPGFIKYCSLTGTQLDFISWHLYSNDPGRHALGVSRAKELLTGISGDTPETMITEWAKGFERIAVGEGRSSYPLSVEEMAFDPKVASITAASAIAMFNAGVDWSFYYHIWDQPCDPHDFESFFSSAGIRNMLQHWNEFPHRFGLFGVEGEVRPHYFVFSLFNLLGTERIAASASDPDLHVIAGSESSTVSTMIANTAVTSAENRIVELQHSNLKAGQKVLTVYKIGDQEWQAPRAMELQPTERRRIFAESSFRCQVQVPANAVVMVQVEEFP